VNFVPGVYVMPSEDNLYRTAGAGTPRGPAGPTPNRRRGHVGAWCLAVWHGAIFVSHGYWAGGVYKFNVEIPSEYGHAALCPTAPLPCRAADLDLAGH